VKRKICVFTGSRAEYGLLKPLMCAIKQERSLMLQVLVSGMHLSRNFGMTYHQIENDGICINERVSMPLVSDTPLGLSKAMAAGMVGISKAYERLKPDMVVLLGDRFEVFSASVAAMLNRIPIAHIHGGEATYGAIDEAMRHSITKMSHLHFTSTDTYRRRVIQLGEDPRRVFCTGALGIDNIKSLKLLSRREFQRWAGIKLNRHNLLITFHPVTLEDNTSKEQFGRILKVLDGLKETTLLFTKANADTFGRVINRMIDDYVKHNRVKARVFTSMGQLNYLSAMKYSDAVVGNSSSGIIEAPSFNIGTINIGNRQAGRIRAKSVIDCLPNEKSMKAAFKKLYSPEFKIALSSVVNPYSGGSTAERISRVLRKANLTDIVMKKFYDVPLNNKKQMTGIVYGQK
jgi:GDP/UDP-N,N'-diacetylbacillosamine 2-epimerase (hydrolysing)